MTKALKSLVLAASVLAASSVMAQTTVEATPTSKCGVEEKCITLPEWTSTATGGNAYANPNQTSTGGNQTANATSNTNNVGVTVFQPGLVNLSECLVKGKFNQVCVAKKLKEVEASLKPFSKCDPLALSSGKNSTKLKCGFTQK